MSSKPHPIDRPRRRFTQTGIRPARKGCRPAIAAAKKVFSGFDLFAVFPALMQPTRSDLYEGLPQYAQLFPDGTQAFDSIARSSGDDLEAEVLACASIRLDHDIAAGGSLPSARRGDGW
jgi:hypothetical protein